jgi:fibronectin-binding autotransporter adhesin
MTNGSLTKAGSGNLILSNTGTSFGTLTANAGQVSIAANAAITGLSGSGGLNLQGGNLTLNASANSTFAGALSGSGGLTKAGNATLTLSGSSSHTGTITVTNGTLVADGTLSDSTISVGHASTTGGSVLMGSGSVGATTINNNGLISPGNSVGTLSVASTLTWNSGGAYLWEIQGVEPNAAGTDWDLISVDTETVGAGTLVLPGSGQFTINGLAIGDFVFDGEENYTGNYFQIVRAANVTGDTANLAFFGTGLGSGSWSFAVDTDGLYLNYSAPTGIIVFSPSGTVNQGDTDIATPSGPWGTIDQGFAVVMDGTGTLVMTNANNSYSGTTTVLSGTLRANVSSLNAADGAFGNAITAITLGDTEGSANATLDIGASGVEVGRAINVVEGSSGTKTIGTSLESGTALYSGNVLLDDSVDLTAGGTANATFSGEIAGDGGIDKVGAGTVTLTGPNTYEGSTTISSGTLVGSTASLPGAILNNANLVFNQTTNGTFANVISGSGSMAKTGGGTLTLDAENTYSGGTTVSAGTLVGSTTSLQGNIANNAAVIISQSTNGTYAGNMSGSGTLALGGGAEVTLSGSSTFSGGTSIDDAAVRATANTALGEGNVALSADGSLLAGSGVTIDNAITVGVGELILYNEDFNAIGSGLPENWTVRTGATSEELGTSTTFTTTATQWNSTTGGFFNYASATGLTSSASAGEQSGSPDRALGVRQNVGLDPGAAINFLFSTAGQVVDSISLDLMMLDVQGRSTEWSLQYGIGSAPTTFTLLGTWEDPGAFGTTPLTFTTADFGTDLDNQSDVVFRLVALSGTTGSGSRDSIAMDNFVISSGLNAAGASGVIGSDITSGTATFSGAVTLNGSARLTAASGGTTAVTGVLSGSGGIITTGAGLVTLSGSEANTFTGATTVTAGTLELNGTGGAAASTSAVSVLSGATLLISQSDQVNNSAAVTLSGGTITRGSGVSEVFGNLNLTTGSFLDFGAGDVGTLTFGTYTPSALLTVSNFFEGNVLTFGSNLTGSISDGGLFSFDNGFTSSWNEGTSTFTITAIPEPSTYAAAAGLLAMMLWPARRRLLKDVKSVLGLREPMRDRLARSRQ